MKKQYRKILILILWLLLWQLASVCIHNKIIFVGPLDVVRSLTEQIWTVEFWSTILHSTVRITGGFLLAFFCGTLVGALAYRFHLLAEFLEPAVGLLQSIPVASFVILALIWIGSGNLAVLISFVVVFPVIYRSTISGMSAVSREMLEMAEVFHMTIPNRLRYLYWSSLLPYLKANAKTVLGMAWKSGVAAEVIGVPDQSIGEKLYMAKIYLSTADLFAWTLVIILVSKLFELLFLWFLEKVED